MSPKSSKKKREPDFYGVSIGPHNKDINDLVNSVQSLVEYPYMDKARILAIRALENLFISSGIYYPSGGGYIIWDSAYTYVHGPIKYYGSMYHHSGFIFNFFVDGSPCYNLETMAPDNLVSEEVLRSAILSTVSFDQETRYTVPNIIVHDVRPFELPEEPPHVLGLVPAIFGWKKMSGFSIPESKGLNKYFRTIFHNNRAQYLKSLKKLQEIKKICEASSGDARYEAMLRLTGLYGLPKRLSFYYGIELKKVISFMRENSHGIRYIDGIKRITGIDPICLVEFFETELENSLSEPDLESIPMIVRYTSPVIIAAEIIYGIAENIPAEVIVRKCISLPFETINLYDRSLIERGASYVANDVLHDTVWDCLSTVTNYHGIYWSKLSSNVKTMLILNSRASMYVDFDIDHLLMNDTSTPYASESQQSA